MLLDVSVWALCLVALVGFVRLSVTHPAMPYLIFHLWFVTARTIAVLNGAPTLFSWPGGDPVSAAEISRAVLMADAALISMTCAWIFAAHRNRRRAAPIGEFPAIPLRLEIVRLGTAIAIPIGLMAMLLWGKVPGLDPPQFGADWAGSNWPVIAQTWMGLGLLALIYCYGFKLGLIAPLIAYFVLVIYQGSFRFRLLIPAILLLQIYVDRRGKRWPPFFAISSFLICAALFFPFKGIGQALQAGEPVNRIWQNAQREMADVFRGAHPDEMILDEFASTLSLADQHRKLFLGRTYSGILSVAVPRQWWREKPGLADFEKEISTDGRPIALDGMVVTMLGEFYVNFSYPGVILISFAFAFLLGTAFHSAYRREYLTLARFAYLLLACNLIQVYRDGLISLFVFVVINMMPLIAIVALHFLYPLRAVRSTPILHTPRVRRHSIEEPVA